MSLSVEVADYYKQRNKRIAELKAYKRALKGAYKPPSIESVSADALGLMETRISDAGARTGRQLSDTKWDPGAFTNAKKAGKSDSQALKQAVKDPTALTLDDVPLGERIAQQEALEKEFRLAAAGQSFSDPGLAKTLAGAAIQMLLAKPGLSLEEATKLSKAVILQEAGLSKSLNLDLGNVDFTKPATLIERTIDLVKEHALPLGAGVLGLGIIVSIFKRS